MSTRTETGRPAAEAAAPSRGLAWLYVIAGGIGLLASGALTLEKIARLRDPDYIPTCSFNPVLSCGSVMDSSQAAVLGFPNPLLGIGGFAVVVTTGVAMLAGFRPPRWYRAGMVAGSTVAVVFIHWLIASSLYDIGALCPYCMVVWAVTIPIFWYSALGAWPALAPLRRVHSAILALWYVVIIALVVQRFWSYWTSLV